MERYGVCGLWLREGAAGLLSAAPFVTPEIAARYPRLDLLRCVVLCLSSQRDEAEARFEAIARRTDGFTRDRKGGDADALAVDRVFAEFALAGGAGRLPSCDIESWLPAASPGAAGNEQGPDARGRPAHAALHGELRTRPFRGVPPARPAGAGAFDRGHAVRRHPRRDLPRHGGHGAGTG